MDANRHDQGVLNTLIDTTIDSIKGYEESAEDTENMRHAQIFRQNAEDRRQALQTLQAALSRVGGSNDNDGSVAGSIHHAWVNLKSAITGQDDKAVVNEVERGEDYIKDKFETALEDQELSAETRRAIEQAYVSVRRGHDQARELKRMLESTS